MPFRDGVGAFRQPDWGPVWPGAEVPWEIHSSQAWENVSENEVWTGGL